MEDPLLGSALDQQQAIELLELTHGSPQTADDGVHIRTGPAQPRLKGGSIEV